MTALRTLFPATRPSLLLDFANGKRLDPRLNFSRNSAATYFDRFGVLKTAAVNEPRFTHDPVTGESLGLMVEEQRTNLLTYSEQFDNAAWVKSGTTVTADVTTAPDGTTTADKLVEDVNNSSHQTRQALTITDNSIVCASAYLKAGERSTALLGIATKGGGFRVRLFNLTDGTNSQPVDAGYTTVPTAYGMDSVGDGWYRCWVANSVDTGAFTNEHFRAFIYNGAPTYTGDGTSGIYIWGAQLEAGSFPTSYIKTEASQATRAADDCNILFGNNLLTYSEQFDNAAWSNTRATVTANAITAPDGTTTADKLVEDTAASKTHFVNQTSSISAGITYTFSVFAKAAERSNLMLDFVTTGSISNYAYFDLSAGTVGFATGVDAAIENIGDGWFRCSITKSAGATITSATRVFISTTSASGGAIYTGDGTSGIYIWGAQLEQSSAPNPYVRTVASPVTGKVWNDWFNPVEGSLYAEWNAPNVESTTRLVFSVSDNATSNWILMGKSTALRTACEVYVGGVLQASIPSGSNNFPGKAIFSYKVNDFASSTNGVLDGTDTLGGIPTVSRADIGDRSTGFRSLNGTIKKLSYYPVRLSNINLQSLTRNN